MSDIVRLLFLTVPLLERFPTRALERAVMIAISFDVALTACGSSAVHTLLVIGRPGRWVALFGLAGLALLLAVLHRHAGIACFDQDVFLNAVGGVKITEPAADLAVLLAIHSSMRNKALPKGLIVFGEVGLAGEIRPSPRGQDRLKEAAKLGFSIALIPKANAPKQPVEGLEVIAVDRIEEAIDRVRSLA